MTKKTITITILTILTLAIAVGGFWYVKNQQKENQEIINNEQERVGVVENENQKTKPEELDTSNWKTYRNEEYGFEVKYPEDWYVKERPVIKYVGEAFKVESFSSSAYKEIIISDNKKVLDIKKNDHIGNTPFFDKSFFIDILIFTPKKPEEFFQEKTIDLVKGEAKEVYSEIVKIGNIEQVLINTMPIENEKMFKQGFIFKCNNYKFNVYNTIYNHKISNNEKQSLYSILQTFKCVK